MSEKIWFMRLIGEKCFYGGKILTFHRLIMGRCLAQLQFLMFIEVEVETGYERVGIFIVEPCEHRPS